MSSPIKDEIFSPPKSYSVASSPVTKPLSIRLVRTPLKELLSSPERKRDSPQVEDENTPEKRPRRGSRPRTPVFSYSMDFEEENLSPVKRSYTRRLSLTPSTKKTTPVRNSRRSIQSDMKKKKSLSPIGEVGGTPLKRNPAVRRLIQEDVSLPPSPRSNRRNLRAPSLSPRKNNSIKEQLFPLDELSDEDDEDEFLPLCSDEEEDLPTTLKTPTKKKTSKPRKQIKTKPKRETPSKTPKQLTPKAPVRKVPLPLDVTDIQEAQLRLHVSSVPESLPCREKEFEEIYNFTEGKIIEEAGGCMYISGVPGTGKTATVKEVIRKLRSEDYIPSFTFIEINGMRLTEPNQAYSHIWKELYKGGSRSKITSEHAMSLLDKKFSSPCDKPVVLLVDELDMLCTTRRQNVLYNLFDWPGRARSNLVVLAIANTMDLPERVMLNRVSSRLGLTRLTFSPYTHSQLQEIVSSRLSGLEIFDPDAVQLVARKVASLSGDARRALDICRRATEIAERRSGQLVSLGDVANAHKEMFSSSKILAIRFCSSYEKVFLRSVLSEFVRTGIEESTFSRVWREMTAMLNLEGLPSIPLASGLDLVGRLSASKLIIAEHASKGLGMKIQLHVSVDDVQFALRGVVED